MTRLNLESMKIEAIKKILEIDTEENDIIIITIKREKATRDNYNSLSELVKNINK